MTDTTATVLGDIELPIEPIKVGELARALRAEPGVVPPTVTVLAAHHTKPGASPNELVIAAAGLDQRRVLLGELTWTYRRMPALGETLTGTVSYLGRDVREGRRGGSLTFARGATVWRDAARAEVVTTEVTLIEPAATAGQSVPRRPSAQPMGVAENNQLVLSRTDIVRYAGAAGDFNPVHHDEPYACRLGYPGVFAMGLLPGGILATHAVRELGPDGPFRVRLRFQGLVWPDVTYRVAQSAIDGGLELVLIDPEDAPVLKARVTTGDVENGGS